MPISKSRKYRVKTQKKKNIKNNIKKKCCQKKNHSVNSDSSIESLQVMYPMTDSDVLRRWVKELSDKNIAVNCVTPAAAKTRIFDQISQQHIDYMLSKIPRNRFAKVEELGSLVSCMASEENSFTTGAVFDLSGGRATY